MTFRRSACLAFCLLQTSCSSYSYREGDFYILILIAALIGMMVFFGIISQERGKLLNSREESLRALEREYHESQDAVRLLRDQVYRAQNSYLNRLEQMLSPEQRKNRPLLEAKRQLLKLEKSILEAENRRNRLERQVALGREETPSRPEW